MGRQPQRSALRKRLPSRKDTVTTAFAIPRPLHRAIAEAGLDLNWTAAQVMRTAIEEWIQRYQARRGRS